jgi:hypothetical protein
VQIDEIHLALLVPSDLGQGGEAIVLSARLALALLHLVVLADTCQSSAAMLYRATNP